MATVYRDAGKAGLAFQWWKRAADMRDGDAAIDVGYCYQYGIGARFEALSALATMCYMRYNVQMKDRVITQRELRNQSAAVLREVEAGRTIVVTRNGTPVGELRPIRKRRFVPRSVIADAAIRAPRIDAARFRADLDAVVNPHVDG